MGGNRSGKNRGVELKRVAVIGGGIAGLAAANKLIEESRSRSAPLEVLLLEKENRLGGTILTEEHDGFIVEGGPDCFLSEKPWALALAERLGIIYRVEKTIEGNKGTFILWGSKLHRLPEGVMLMVPTRILPMVTSSLLTWRGKMRMAMELFVPPRTDGVEESLSEFVTRRLGREALERIAEPLVAGVHAGEPEKMSLSASFPRFKEMEDRYHSLVRGMLARMKTAKITGRWTMFVTFSSGLGELVGAIETTIGENNIRKGAAASAIEPGASNSWRVIIDSGEVLDADAVILSAPAHASAKILSGLDLELSSLLNAVPYVGTATVSLAYNESEIAGSQRGFGFVVPRIENRRIMAVTFSSRKFPKRAPAGKALLRCFIGGAQHPELVEKEPGELVKVAVEEVADILKIKADPLWARVYRWPKSMPQANVGHLGLMREIRSRLERHAGLEIAGGAYEGLGIPDCVRVGENAAIKILDRIYS